MNAMNITKDGVEVKVGQTWRDLDKRMKGRKRKVIRVEDGRAHLDGPRSTSLAIARMHRHATGWELAE